MNYRVMILVDRSMNYANLGDVNGNKLEEELLATQTRQKRSILYFGEISAGIIN